MEPVESSSQKDTFNNNSTKPFRFTNDSIFIFACGSLAFLLRFFLIPQNSVINGDGIYYATLGQKMMAGDFFGGISGYWSPFYSFLVGLSSLFFDDLEFAGRFVSVVAGAILIVPAFFLFRNLCGRIPAYLATILLVVHPLLIKSSGWVMTESVYTLIFTTGLLTSWLALRAGRKIYFFITGLLFGAAYLTKPEAVGFLVLLFIITVCAKYFRRKLPFQKLIAGYLILLSAFLILSVPYIIFLYQKTGRWTISQKIMINLPAADFDGELLSLTPGGEMTMQDRIWSDDYETKISPAVSPKVSANDSEKPSGIKSTVEILGAKAKFLLIKQLREYIPVIVPYFFIFVIIVGFCCRHRTKFRMAGNLFLLSFFVATLVGYALSAVELRYLFPLIPILMCWAATGIFEVSKVISKALTHILKTKKAVNPLVISLIGLLGLIVLFIPPALRQFSPGSLQNVPFEEKQAGLWIRNHSEKPAIVMSSHATAAFYASAKHLFLPNEEFQVVLDYARRRKVDYWIFSQRRLKNTPKAFPANEENLPQDLKIIYRDDSNPDYLIQIYQIIY